MRLHCGEEYCKFLSSDKTLTDLQQYFEFFYRREGITEFLRHIIFCRICSHTHWLVIILNDILHILLVSALAED